jgi:hypothetical protein
MYYLMSKAAPSVEALENASLEKAIEYATDAQAIGFGNASVPLLVAAPFILLFSYTRLPKNPRISILIPVIGIVLIILMVVEGSYQVLGALSLKTKPIPIREFYDKFIEILKAFAQLSDT